MTLRLGRPLGIGELRKEQVTKDWNTYDAITTELEQQGLGTIHIPTGDNATYPILTEEMLNTIDPKTYSSHFVKFSSWMTYLSEIRSHVDAQILQNENISDHISAENRRRLRDANRLSTKTDKLTVQEMDDAILLMPEKQEVIHKLQELIQRKLIVTAQLDAVDRSLRVLSRQIEVRRLDMEHVRIESNTPRREPSSRWESRK
jgi:hypothetical protein